MQNKIHGVRRTKGLPGRVVNVSSRKNKVNNKIRLDKILKSPKPRIRVDRRLGGAGDVLMSTPLLKNIKRIMPHCELTYRTDLQYMEGALGEIIKHNPYVDVLLGNGEGKDSDYDYTVDITTTGLDREKAGCIPPNRIDMFAEEAGIDVSSDPVPDYIVTGQEKENAQLYIKEELGIEDRSSVNIIAIQCRSNDERRTWPLEYVDQLADLIVADNNNNIVLLMDWGHTVNRWQSRDRIFAIKDLPFVETAALIEQVDLVVCPDSSILHLAGALNKKIVTIFGPIPYKSRINHYPNATAISIKLNCSNCWYTPSCVDRSKLECLTLIKPEMVLEAINKKMKEDIQSTQNIIYGKDITIGGQDNIIYVKRASGGLGDILMCGPALKALKLKYPKQQIHFAIPEQYIPLMQNLDFIDEVIDINTPINKNRYYMIMDLSTPCARYEYARVSMKKPVEKSRVEIFTEALGVRNLMESYVPYYNVTSEEKEEAKELLYSYGNIDKNKKIIAIHPKSAEVYRDYKHENIEPLIKELMKDYNVIMMGSNRDLFIPGLIDICNYPIRKMAATLLLCDGFITVDTGPLHVAAALNIPTIALFGPIDYKARCKGYKNVTVIKSNLECIPCWRNGITKCNQTGMVKATSKCMDIPINTIIKTARIKFK